MKSVLRSLCVVLLVLFVTVSCNASPIYDVNIGDQIYGISFNPLTNAGRFSLYDMDTDHLWNSFCLELNSGLPQTTYVGGISDYAIPGGAGGGTSVGDPISDFTAWLYYSSETGGLFDYTGSDVDSRDLQYLIWYEEEEISHEAFYLNPIRVARWRDDFSASGWMNTDNVVQVLNLYVDRGLQVHAQDQLVMSRPVPEPATMFLFSLGLLTLAGFSRKSTGLIK